jgi:iron complex transport system substrate-binding protein
MGCEMKLETPGVAAYRSAVRVRVLEPRKTWRLREPVGHRASGPLPTRREFLVGAGSLLLLAPYGCGPEQGADETTQEKSSARRFEDDTGNVVEIPARPGRVVTLDDRTLEAALAVEAPVVGAVGRYREQPVPPAFDELAEDVQVVGVQPNLEAIARLEPDLILGQGYAVEEVEDQLRRIAPVVVLEYWEDDSYTTTQWEEHFRRVADALGRKERAAKELARLERAVEKFREDFPGDPADVALSVVQMQPEEWLYFTQVSFCGEMVEILGFSRPESQRASDTDRVYLSYEELPLADGDAIILTAEALEEGVPEKVEEVTESPLWQSLDAVEEGDVYQMDGFLWLTAGSVPGGLAIIEDLREAFIS